MDNDLQGHCIQGNIWDLFHKLWTKAVGQDNYEKEYWRQLETKIIKLQKVINGRMDKEDSGKVKQP